MTDEREVTADSARDDIRRALNQEGPLFIPEHFKDPNYRYYWNTHSKRQPFKFRQAISLGYAFVHPSEMGDIEDMSEGSHVGFSFSEDGSRIMVQLNTHDTAYLMKIPTSRFKEIQKIKLEEVLDSERALERKSKKQNFYGDIEFAHGQRK